ncbi:cyclic peptide export ABC transporter [Pseudomonas sp. BJa5]|uniref:cyclic peptide export ABC transporter n=1 Tax=Pseudomonas sp. BJa5 TaxID=2936270 RepID=UPI002559A4F4|nr:cyclic peptide export ABC transporter [Pseudomonas sp. BGr12]MDL2423792.1 cyclic peptide export ABC transporter [Pseudomonas sp. BGr12]
MNSSSRGATRELLQLLRPFWPIVLLSIALGIIGGASVTLLLAQINQALHTPDGVASGMLWAFAGLCLLSLLGTGLSDMGSNFVGQRIILKLRKELGEKVLCAPIDQIERYKSHRLIPVLTHDIYTIRDFSFAFAPLTIALTVSLGCLGYLAMLSWPLFLLLVGGLVLGLGAQLVARRRAIEGFDKAREAEDELQKQYHAIAEGAKELRMHRPRRNRLFNQRILGTAEAICQTQIRAMNTFIVAKSFGSTLFFVVIGLALVIERLLPGMDKAAMSGFVLVLLYMKGPLDQLVSVLPIVSRAQIAFRRVADLSRQFSSPEPHLLLNESNVAPLPFTSLELRNAGYTFAPSPGVVPFSLGPVNLKVQRGEIVFIVGENGGGKTTLIKLLLGLYAPQRGELRLNGQLVTPETRDDYRQSFTTIFADYFLFDDLVQSDAQVPQAAEQYLQRLQIAHKVGIDNGRFTTTDLSTGQRKRLALVSAWLEQRPVLVFDEWAADQDPAFRHIFYTELLPELKRLGKTIIVISHDDRYFHIADQLLRMQAGCVASALETA